MATWSETARRDFREREDYRKKHGELDRYRKRGDYSDEDYNSRLVDARLDNVESRDWEDDAFDMDNTLMQIRNAGPDDDVSDSLARLRARYDYIESKLDRYDADYDYLMANYDALKDYSVSKLMSQGTEIKEEQLENIREDGKPKSYDDLWKNREG